MDEAIKEQFRFSKKAKAAMVISLIIFFCISAFIYKKIYTDIRAIVTKQAIDSITNISELNVDSVSTSIQNIRALLETISGRLSKKQPESVEEVLEEMKGYVKYYDLYSMGVLWNDFTLHLTSGEDLDVSGWSQFKDAWDDEFHISASYMPAAGGASAVNMLSVPVFYGDEMQYVIISGVFSRNLTERMNINSIGGKGYNFLVNIIGNVVIYPRLYENEEYNKLMAYVSRNSNIIPTRRSDSHFEYNGERYYAHSEPLGINNWYLMTCAKEKDVFADANAISRSVFMGLGLLWLMILSASFITAYSIYKSRKEIKKAVMYDELLDIGNMNLLTVLFNTLPQEKFQNMMLTMFDIDRFKEFNYIYGDECGDNLLKYIVRVFHEELPDDYLFRYLADNFIALIHCSDRGAFVEKMERLLHRFSRDIEDGIIQPFDISAGVCDIREGENLRRITSDALIARGTIKGIQVQQYAFYDENIRRRRMSYMEMESDFARALKDKEFHVYYQPKYDMRNGKIIGAEALVRWVKADGTIVSPGMFIPCFESSRQIILLDEAMLKSVCRQMKEMENDGIDVKKVSVNLSRVHLKHPGILPKIEHIIKESGINTDNLSFEITESALYEDSIPLKHIVDSLHGLGCKVDMDDYGVGVSTSQPGYPCRSPSTKCRRPC